MVILALIIAILFLGLVPMIFEIKNGRFDVFNVKNAFILYYVIQLGFSGLLAIYFDMESDLALDVERYYGYYVKAYVASFIGLLAFRLGYYVNIGHLRLGGIILGRLEEASILRVRALYMLLAVAASLLFFKSYGGVLNFLDQVETFRAGGVSGNGILLIPMTSLLNILCCLYLLSPRSRTKRLNLKFKAYAIIAGSILPAFILGFRSLWMLPLLSYTVVFYYTVRRFSVVRLVLLFLVIGTLFTGYGLLREVPKGVKVDIGAFTELIQERPDLALALISRSRGIEVISTVIRKIEIEGGHEFGVTAIIEASTILIPRGIWMGKPTPSNVRFTTYFFGERLAKIRGINRKEWGGVSPTIIGDSFWQFGWLGVFLAPFGVGLLYRLFYTTFLVHKGNPIVVLSYAMLYPLLVMLPETLLGYLNSIIISVVTLILTILFLKVRWKI